jgi:SAP domain-containing new25
LRTNKIIKLTKNITEQQFENSYWYVEEIKAFAKEIGIANSSKLRKDELEKLIKEYIRTGKIGESNRKKIVQTGKRDFELGLKLSLPIINYTNNKQTKNFIEQEAHKINPAIKKKSGVSYRLNRWREEQITKGEKGYLRQSN